MQSQLKKTNLQIQCNRRCTKKRNLARMGGESKQEDEKKEGSDSKKVLRRIMYV